MRSPIIDRVYEFTLLGMVASGFFAVWGAGDLPWLLRLVMLAALGLRAFVVSGVVPGDLSNKWVTPAAVFAVLFYVADYFWISKDFVDATVHLLFAAVLIQLISARSERDFLWLRLLAFLEIMAGAILSANASFFLFLLVFLLCGLANFAAGEVRSSARVSSQVSRQALKVFPSRLMKLTSAVALGVVGLTVILFFVLPRTTRAALQSWIDPRYHLTGFSNSVILGQIGELRMKREPVMHVRTYPENLKQRIRWRGAALPKFTGRIWSSSVQGRRRLDTGTRQMVPLVDDNHRRRRGDRYTFEVQLRPTGSDTLFIPGIPEFLQINVPSVYRTPAGSFFSSYLSGRVVRYAVHTYVNEPLAPGEPPGINRQEFLELPMLDARIRGLAAEWATGTASEIERAKALESHLRTGYKYSTELLDREVPDPLAHFLFDRGKGHCEYFASALAVMLRSVDIPSRVVTGFLGGEYNPVSGWHVVRASDAHSWVEAYIEGVGWITLDPTPPASREESATWIARVNDYFDAFETFWQDWILSYNLEQQVTLAMRTERASTSMLSRWIEGAQSKLMQWWQRIKRLDWPVIFVAVCLAALILAGPFVVPRIARWWTARARDERFRRGRVKPKDATLLYRQLLDTLRRQGIEKPEWVTPLEFAGMVADSRVGPLVAEMTGLYNTVRFSADKSGAERMAVLLREVRKAAVLR